MISIKYFGAWLMRFRKRCGYGVHSPFAFSFITGVVFENGAYYAYKDLDDVYKNSLFWHYSHRCKCLHFLFRLTNYVRPRFIVGDCILSDAEVAYMRAASQTAVWLPWVQVDLSERILFYANTDVETLPALLKRCADFGTSDSVLLLRVTSSEERLRCSEIIAGCEISGVSFDLYDYLLVFFDKNLFKQHYVVNFLD